jgi:hypothetical protein
MLGEALASAGRADEAKKSIEEALPTIERTGSLREAERARALLAQVV